LSQVSLDFVSAAARILARDMARVARGQEVLIYADSESDSCVAHGGGVCTPLDPHTVGPVLIRQSVGTIGNRYRDTGN
jgi:hypothetical protein